MTDRAAPAPVRRAAITNLGCKVNQAEMDAVVRLFRARGVEIVGDGLPADIHLVNTCTVTGVADDKSRKAVRRARRASPGGAIVVTGCAVQVDPGAFAAVDPAARLVGNEEKDRLLGEVARLLRLPEGDGSAAGGVAGAVAGSRGATGAVAGSRGAAGAVAGSRGAAGAVAGSRGAAGAVAGSRGAVPGVDVPHGPLDAALPTLAGVEIAGITDDRARIDRTRAYVKVQDGCSFHCTYCIIPRARGAERSLPADVVLADVRRALADGHREIVLTGINIGTYDGGRSERGARGARTGAALTLAGLVRRILAETPVERIRLSSIEPQHVDDELLATWTGEGAGRCLPHLHLPLQSGDDGVLRRMGRRYDTAAYAQIVARIRSAVPGVALHADVIAGFPTEDDAAFERSLAFIRALDPAGLHVFRYSPRPGTPATRMAGQVPEPVRKERAAVLLAEASTARARRAARAVGATRTVLFEAPSNVPALAPDEHALAVAPPSALGSGWTGHAEDYVVVRAGAPADRVLAGEIGLVVIDALDPFDPERVVGRVERLLPRPAAAPSAAAPRALPVVPLATP